MVEMAPVATPAGTRNAENARYAVMECDHDTGSCHGDDELGPEAMRQGAISRHIGFGVTASFDRNFSAIAAAAEALKASAVPWAFPASGFRSLVCRA